MKSEQRIDEKRKASSHDFLFRWAVGPRLLALTPRGQLSDIDSPASYMPDMLSHAKHRVISIFASRTYVRTSTSSSSCTRKTRTSVRVHTHSSPLKTSGVSF